MLRAQINCSSLLEKVLLHVLDNVTMKMSDENKQSEIYLIDLDYLANHRGSFNYNDQSPLIGFTFIPPEIAILDHRIIFFDCPYIFIVKKPFLLSYIQDVIKNAPNGFDKVYAHPGINLFWHLGKFNSLGFQDRESKFLIYQIQILYPDILEKCNGDLFNCLNKMPFYILKSIYKGLAHAGDNVGLEGMLGKLAGEAQNYLKDKKRKESYFKEICNFLSSTERQRKALYSHTRDIKNLNEIIQNFKNQIKMDNNIISEIKDIYKLHIEIQNFLEKLEDILKDNLNSHNPKEVVQNAINAGEKINKLSNLLKGIRL